MAEREPDLPIFAWGQHRNWHGEIWREDLNAISCTRPLIMIHRSFHETVMNNAALKYFEIDEAEDARLASGRHRARTFLRGWQPSCARRQLAGYLLSPQRRAGDEADDRRHPSRRPYNGRRHGIRHIRRRARMGRLHVPPSTTTTCRFASNSFLRSPSPGSAPRSNRRKNSPNAIATGCASASTSSCLPTAHSSRSSCNSAVPVISTAMTANG